MDQSNKKVKILYLDKYKEKLQKKKEWIKEFEEGPQAIEGCTCGQHTDPNQFLREAQVTKYYIEDRKRYLKDLKGSDPMEDYMETVNNLMSDGFLVKLNMNTDFLMMEDLTNHFNRAMDYYQDYIKRQKELSDQGKLAGKNLKISYQIYKSHIVKSIINSYIIEKRYFIGKNSNFAWRKNELLTRKDSLDTYLNESQGYIKFIETHFKKKDEELKNHYLSIVAKNLDWQIDKGLKGVSISSLEIDILGDQLEESIDIIEKIKAKNSLRDYEFLKKKYDENKDDYSIQYKAECLIDLELRSRSIDDYKGAGASDFTANNSTDQLIETIGMEKLISKMSTNELESLLEQFRDHKD